MEIKKVVVAGGGVLGSQIGYQIAFKGYDVTMWLRSEDSIKRTQPKIEELHKTYLKELEDHKQLVGKKGVPYARGLFDSLEDVTLDKIEELKKNADKAFENIKYETDMAKAVSDADLVIESVAEIPSAKTEFYTELSKHLKEDAIVVTNTSSLLPSMFREATKRPEKYLALHFANRIWRNNIAEVMKHSTTEDKYFDIVFDFARRIGMIPLKVNKEQPGYLLNSLLIPFLTAAETLLANEVSDPETIDKAWTIGTGAPFGPFRILDIIGLETAYNVVKMSKDIDVEGSNSSKIAKMLKKYIDEGKTGIAKGEGFFKYN